MPGEGVLRHGGEQGRAHQHHEQDQAGTAAGNDRDPAEDREEPGAPDQGAEAAVAGPRGSPEERASPREGVPADPGGGGELHEAADQVVIIR